jgi:uncharacterized repeat protein (TIGR03803 family)
MSLRVLVACLVVVTCPRLAAADLYEVLASFDGTGLPTGMTAAPDGSLFGTTCSGGTYNEGSVFKLAWNGGSWVRSVVFSFDESVHGGCPQGMLLLGADGAFYGTTLRNSGVFRVTPTGVFARIHAFTAPETTIDATLIQGGEGALYGTTMFGGALSGGSIYRMQLVSGSWSYTVLHSFTPATGAYPEAGLVAGPDGAFYGTTESGGNADKGVIYRLALSGGVWTYSVLHHFDGTDGASPFTPPVWGPGGAFFGTTTRGGSSDKGVVYRLIGGGTTWSYSVIHQFTGANGANAYWLVNGGDGALYGTTLTGGTEDRGTLFRLSSSGSWWMHTLLHDFMGTQGTRPLAMAKIGSAFFGTTVRGGATNRGTVFTLTGGGTSWSHQIVEPFAIPQGAVPSAAVMSGADGALYGTTQSGGSMNLGTAFRMAKQGSTWPLTTLHSFHGDTAGATPAGGLTPGVDGALYGATQWTGEPGIGSGNGTVYRLALSGGTWTHSVIGALDGLTAINPWAGVVPSPGDGVLVTTYRGGTSGLGTVVSAERTGGVWNAQVISNLDTTTGGYPKAALLRASDGTYYGTTTSPSRVFRIWKSGSLWLRQVIWTFAAADGQSPEADLVQGPDGALYGTTTSGGTFNLGTVFRLANGGGTWGLTVLHHFNGISGRACRARLVFGLDGMLYGMTERGGAYDQGTVFKLSGANLTYYELVYDFVPQDGIRPRGGLTVGTDGALYGTTTAGGPDGGGVVFRLDVGPPTVSITGTASVVEGHTGFRKVFYWISLSKPWTSNVTVSYSTFPGTATAGVDFLSNSGTMMFTPGNQTTMSVAVAVVGDTTPEPNETYSVRITNVTGGYLGTSSATTIILNDD